MHPSDLVEAEPAVAQATNTSPADATSSANAASDAARPVPASVRHLCERIERIAASSRDELVTRALTGLVRLRAGLLPGENQAATEAGLVRALARATYERGVNESRANVRSAREQDADARAAREVELQSSEGALELARKTSALETALADARLTLAALQLEHESQRSALAALENERDGLWAARAEDTKEFERRGAELETRLALAEQRSTEFDALTLERALQQSALEESARELTALRDLGAARDAEFERLRDEKNEWVNEQRMLERSADSHAAERKALEAELRWREREMEHVRLALESVRFALVGRELRQRARAWSERNRKHVDGSGDA